MPGVVLRAPCGRILQPGRLRRGSGIIGSPLLAQKDPASIVAAVQGAGPGPWRMAYGQSTGIQRPVGRGLPISEPRKLRKEGARMWTSRETLWGRFLSLFP